MKDVTVAIKTFERPDSLKDLLLSIRRFYPDIHIKIADDSKKSIGQDITAHFSNIEYILLRFDVGLSAGRNELLSRITSKYFVLCDDDFLFSEQTRLENFKKILDETDVELVGGCVMDRSSAGNYDKPNLYAGNLNLDSAFHLHMEAVNLDKPFVRCDIVPNWFMANAEAVKRKTGGWDKKLKIEEHTDFFWRAKIGGLKVAFAPNVCVNHTLVRNPQYDVFRKIRNDEYYFLYFRKLGIKGFTDRWETVVLKEVWPQWLDFGFDKISSPWVIMRQWKNLDFQGNPHIKHREGWRVHFLFGHKFISWAVVQKWEKIFKDVKSRLEKKQAWLYDFVWEQKCVPWFLITKWRVFTRFLYEWRSFKTIDLEKTFVSCLDGAETIRDIEQGKIGKYPNLLLMNSIDVRFLKEFKDKSNITDEEIKTSKYYFWAYQYMQTYGSFQGKKDSVALVECCRDFLNLYQSLRNKFHAGYLEKIASIITRRSKYTYPLVYRILNSNYSMILDGHHRLACLYVLGSKKAKVKIVGAINNRLQPCDVIPSMTTDTGWNIYKKISTRLNHCGLILMYHRVIELASDPWQLSISPKHFEQQMHILKKYGCPVQMQEMGKSLNKISFGQKKIVISFDDGYVDNFSIAKPILEQYEIPATFFIVTGVIDSCEEFWWDKLEGIILTSCHLPHLFELDIVGTEYRWRINQNGKQDIAEHDEDMLSIPKKDSLLSSKRLYFVLWRILSYLLPQARKDVLQQISQWAGQSTAPRSVNLPLTSNQLISLARCPLFEIGAHTVSHPALSRLSQQEQEKEIASSKQDLEKMIYQPVTSFSYPFGKYSYETAELVKYSKFQSACTTEEQPVWRNSNPYLLPRFAVLNWDGDQFEKHLRRWMAYE